MKKHVLLAVLASAFGMAQKESDIAGFESVKNEKGHVIKWKRTIDDYTIADAINMVKLNGTDLSITTETDKTLSYAVDIFLGKPYVTRIGGGYSGARNCENHFTVSLFEIRGEIKNIIDYKNMSCEYPYAYSIKTIDLEIGHAKNKKFNFMMALKAVKDARSIAQSLNKMLELSPASK